MPRFAVLWALDETSQPIGLAIEKDRYVFVALPDGYGMPDRYDGNYNVLQPDSSRITYRPGDAGYFDQVLIDLSRVFSIGEQATVPAADQLAVLHLLVEKVLRPRDDARVGVYGLDAPPIPEPARLPRYCERRNHLFSQEPITGLRRPRDEAPDMPIAA